MLNLILKSALYNWENMNLFGKPIKRTINIGIIIHNLMMIKLKKKLIWIPDILNNLVMIINEEHLL
jgi:hypothetical protein